MLYFWAFISAVIISFIFTALIKQGAKRLNIFDDPQRAPERKIQPHPVPLLGGVAIYLTVITVILFNLQDLLGGYLLDKHLWGLGLGGLVLIIGGILDDRYDLLPKYQLIFPSLAALIVVSCGIGINYITNPFGGIIALDQWQWTVFNYQSIPYKVILLADVFTVCWLMGMMYATKFLDGLDGLVSGITTIGSIIIFCLSLTQEVWQPETALLGLIIAGASLGFLILNFHPAKIYLGEGGSLLTGFLLGGLAIISGGKIATALLIMGLPLIDAAWVIFQRVFLDRQSPFKGDKKHLHFRLLDIGFSQQKTVLILYLITAVFGSTSLFLAGPQKLLSLGGLLVVVGGLSGYIYYKYRKHLTLKLK